MKKAINFLLLSGLTVALVACNKTPGEGGVDFNTVLANLSDNNGHVSTAARISYADGSTEDASVESYFTSKATLTDYDAKIEALGSDYVDYGFVNVDGGVALYFVDDGELVFNRWVLAGEDVSVDDYVPSVSLLAKCNWEELSEEEAESTGYTHHTIQVYPVKFLTSLINSSWIASYTTSANTYSRVSKTDGVVSMDIHSEFTFTNIMSNNELSQASLNVTITDIGTTKIDVADTYLATNPTFEVLTDWPAELKDAMETVSGAVVPFTTLSKYVNISVEKMGGVYSEWSVEDYGIGDQEDTMFAAIESMGFERNPNRGGSATSVTGSYTIKVFEKLLQDATPKSGKIVNQIQCNFVNPDYLGRENGSGIMQMYGSIYTYKFEGTIDTSIVKSSETGVNAYLSTLLDINNEPVFPTLDFDKWGGEIYMEDKTEQAAATISSTVLNLNLYIPVESDAEMLEIRKLIFDQIIGYKSWGLEEDYQLYWYNSDYYTDDSQVTINSGSVDLDGDGEKEKVCVINIAFNYN
ncbi:MAG: hypothetical protein ACI31G_02660 [Bacilli bacterium]